MKAVPTTIRSRPPLAPIRLGVPDRSAADARFGRLLVGFMRVLSALWLLQGAVLWAAVLTAEGEGAGALDTMTAVGAGATMFFCAVDMIAAVGLWLAAPWGGAVWLVAVGGHWLSTFVLPGFFEGGLPIGLGALVLVAIYFALTYKAARENAPYV